MSRTIVAGAILVLVGVWSQMGLAAGPRAVVPELTHDFGQVFEDRPLIHRFVIENRGQETLEILDVDPDCDCTVAEYDRRIPPGGQGHITLSIKPYSVLRKFDKQTKVRLNDRESAQVIFTLKGEAQPIIEIQPSHIVRLRGRADDRLEGQVRFISHLPFSWEISSFQTNIPDKIDVSLRAETPGKVYVLEVRNKSRDPGRYAGKIDLVTNSQKRPRLLVRVFGEISS